MSFLNGAPDNAVQRRNWNWNVGMGAGVAAVEIEIISVFKQNIIGQPLPVPAHEPNDMIFVVSKAAWPGTPPLPSGFTNVVLLNNTYATNYRLSYYIDANGTYSMIPSTSGTLQLFGIIYRNVIGVGNVASSAEILGTNLNTVALALDAGRKSHVLACAEINQGCTYTNPADHTLLFNNLIPNLGGGNISAWDDYPMSNAYASESFVASILGFNRMVSVELLAGTV